MIYMFAYLDLGSCRNYEGGEIPWTAMKAYADEYEFDEDQRVILYNVIREVDIWFLKEVQAKADKKNGTKPKRGHGGSVKKVLPIGQRG
jgi:hypothetical protein